ncbi:hypothetical protein CTAYLR_007287 [Chrysophaeum taylorii]|uniref:Uncharacterized protein n=1 Tax=Chrysophaeum taylorii TaxID=2483200 RepID=A0AAD7XN20_9STRA|nr:hypothetical protein CTAYLR_007287 [Chrysophaeum taylorii]
MNHDGGVDLREFRTRLKEPLDRLPLLRRVFASMDAAHDDSLGIFEFFVGYYSLCTLPHGDYMIRFLWEMYDEGHRGRLSEETFRALIRESMAACLPDYLVRVGEELAPEIMRKLKELRSNAEPWMSMKPGEIVIRIDQDGHSHVAVVRSATDETITVQDVYTVDNPLGWTQGRDNTFTYSTAKHNVSARVLYHEPGTPLFDDKLEKFLVITADRNDDGAITLKEFRRLLRRRVSKGEPSPYAAMLELKKKVRATSGLTDTFWDHQALELIVQIEKHGVWNAAELYRKELLGHRLERPPRKYGGEQDGDQLRAKPRRTQLDGEEMIEVFARNARHAALVGDVPLEDVDGAALVAGHDEATKLDRLAETSKLEVTVESAVGLAKADASVVAGLWGLVRRQKQKSSSDPFCTVRADDAELGHTQVCRQNLDPLWNITFEVSRVPRKLEVRIWDWDGKDRRQPLGFVTVLRPQIRKISKTRKKTIALKIQGRTTDDRDATGTLTLRLKWIAPPKTTPDDQEAAVALENTNNARQLEKEHESEDANDELSANAPQFVEEPYVVPPMPAIEVSWLRSMPETCRCGLRPPPSALDMLRHVANCPTALDDPDSLVDMLYLARWLDPNFDAKERSRLDHLGRATSCTEKQGASPVVVPNSKGVDPGQHDKEKKRRRRRTTPNGLPELPRASETAD